MTLAIEILGILIFGFTVYITAVTALRIREMSTTVSIAPVVIALVIAWMATAAFGGWFS